jgi:hypothetical protein
MIKNNKRFYTVAIAVFLLSSPVLLLGSALAAPSTAQISPSSFNAVRVFIQTSSSDLNYYVVSAYNSTGYLVASYQSSFPAASFELPDGKYLLTVTAMQQYNYYPYPVGAEVAKDSVSYSIAIGRQPVIEYGYSLTTVSGSNVTNITVSTKNLTDFPTSKITVHVSFPDGSAVSGAQIYASILGNGYWWYGDSGIVMSSNTENGVAALNVPSVPVLISSWAWIPVELPKKETIVQVTVGGELVNVTVYWQPTYVGFAGEALVIPPTDQVDIRLHSQPPSYWVMPYDVKTGVAEDSRTGSAETVASSAGGIPSYLESQVSGNSGLGGISFVSPTQIPPLQAGDQTTTTPITTTKSTSTSEASGSSESNPIMTAFYILALVTVILAALLTYSLTIVRKIRKDVPATQ